LSWEIEKSAEICCRCNRQLEPGDDFVATLVEEGESFARRDYCNECWGQGQPAFSFWRTRVPTKEQKQKTFVDDDMLTNLFLRLADCAEPLKRKFRFVLMLILMRKRLVKYEKTIRRDGEEFWRMSCKATDEPQEVWDPKLDELQIQEVSGELSSVLNMEI